MADKKGCFTWIMEWKENSLPVALKNKLEKPEGAPQHNLQTTGKDMKIIK